MKLWIAAAAALLSVPTAALACSCLATDDPVELRRLAPEAARNAIALVEVETLVPFGESNGAGDRMRVVRTLAGSAASEFRVLRGRFPSSASCDLLFERGQRGTVILYPVATAGADASLPTYRISGLCTGHLLEQPVFRDEMIRLIGGGVTSGERG